MAVDAGVRVIATTRGRERVALLEKLGAERVETEGPELSKRIAEAQKLDAVLDLVGNSTILDSLAMLRRGGRACKGIEDHAVADKIEHRGQLLRSEKHT